MTVIILQRRNQAGVLVDRSTTDFRDSSLFDLISPVDITLLCHFAICDWSTPFLATLYIGGQIQYNPLGGQSIFASGNVLANLNSTTPWGKIFVPGGAPLSA
ncbi:MAG: hypothetical protein R3E79_54680 [Caldilineaceae bacterium]